MLGNTASTTLGGKEHMSRYKVEISGINTAQLKAVSYTHLFCGCFYVMNQHYDELARYPYELSEEQREVVLSHFDTENINYLVCLLYTSFSKCYRTIWHFTINNNKLYFYLWYRVCLCAI